MDQACRLEPPGGLGDALPAHPEQVGNRLLGDVKLGAAAHVEARQQPAAQLLIDRMEPVAQHVLGNLGEQRLGVGQGQPAQAAALVELPAQHLGPHAVGLARALHDDPVVGRLAAQHQGDADHSVAPGHRHLDGGAILGGGDQ